MQNQISASWSLQNGHILEGIPWNQRACRPPLVLVNGIPIAYIMYSSLVGLFIGLVPDMKGLQMNSSKTLEAQLQSSQLAKDLIFPQYFHAEWGVVGVFSRGWSEPGSWQWDWRCSSVWLVYFTALSWLLSEMGIQLEGGFWPGPARGAEPSRSTACLY